METDSFFCQLFKHLPQTLFELIGQPAEQAKSYRFDAVEVKKSFRIDGLFVPRKARLPLYFVEVQFRRARGFYANLFAKVFCYLEENDPRQDWMAVAIFPGRWAEPLHLAPYLDLLHSKRVRRIYLDEYLMPADTSLGLGILQLVSASEGEAPQLVARLLTQAERELTDSGLRPKVVQLVEELLIRRFAQLSREEVRVMFKLHDIRKTRVWQEARAEGREEGREEGKTLAERAMVQKWLTKGLTMKQIAELMEIPLEDVRRLAKGRAS